MVIGLDYKSRADEQQDEEAASQNGNLVNPVSALGDPIDIRDHCERDQVDRQVDREDRLARCAGGVERP